MGEEAESSDGGFNTPYSVTATAEANGGPKGGVWVPCTWDSALADHCGDPRLGWIGLIVAKVAPIITANGSFKVISRFD